MKNPYPAIKLDVESNRRKLIEAEEKRQKVLKFTQDCFDYQVKLQNERKKTPS